MYQLDLIDTPERFFKLQREWDDLLSLSSTSTVFQTFEWCAAWWRAVGCRHPTIKLQVLVVRDHGEPRGIAPLMLQHQGPSPISAELRPELCRYLGSERAKGNRIDLNEIPAGSRLLVFCRSETSCPWLTVRPSTGCPWLDLTDDARFAEVANKREYVVKTRRLHRMGQLVCHHHVTAESIRTRLPLFKAMHGAQWNHRADAVATFAEPDVDRFFRELVDTLGPRGWIVLTELALDARPIAYYFSFVYAKTYWAYRTCFETQLTQYSPGHVMLRYILHDFKQRKYTTFDFMRGDYPYKYRYASSERQIYRMTSGQP